MTCPSCHSVNLRRLGPIPPDYRFAGRELDRLVGGGELVACRHCHLHFRWPRPNADQLTALYRDGSTSNWQDEPASRVDWEVAASWLRRHQPDSRVLDVGCFDGRFLNYLGPSFQRFGVEPHEGAADRSRAVGVTILGATLDALDDRFDAHFDSVVGFDVIEHVLNPQDFVARAHRLLRPSGSLIIGTGNVDAPTRRFMGPRYWYCAIPEHVSFINERWVKGIAESLGMKQVFRMTYSHHPDASLVQRLRDGTINVVSRVAPPLWRRFRSAGLGGVKVSLSDQLRDYPPQWMTAKDHLLVILQK